MQRESGLEALRILAMLVIIVHHYSVHGVWPGGGIGVQVTLDLLSLFGKVGCNLFVMISGYFLVCGRFKSRSLLRTVAENTFYG